MRNIIDITFKLTVFSFLLSIGACKNLSRKQKDKVYSSSLNYDSLLKQRTERVKNRIRRAEMAYNLSLLQFHGTLLRSVVTDDDIANFIAKSRRNNDSLLYTPPIKDQSINYEIVCQDTTFKNRLDITNCNFLKKFDLSSNSLEDIELQNDTFSWPTISDSRIDGELYCYNCRFENLASFTGLKVSDNIEFVSTYFNDVVSFSYSRFYGDFNLENAEINSGIIFLNTTFEGDAVFRNLRLSDSAQLYFKGAVLPRNIDFSYNNRISKEIDLTTASFLDSLHYNSQSDIYIEPHYISLYKSDIAKFHLDYIHFRLVTDSAFTNDGEIHKFKIPKDDVDGMYEALLNNFKIRGQDESYKLLDIEFQEYKWKNSGFPRLSILSKYWWNYGYNKELIFLWMPLFLFGFTLITFFYLEYLNAVYVLGKLGAVPSFKDGRLTVKDSYKRMWLAFVYTSTIFFRLTLKVEEINYRKLWGTLYILLIYTVGLVCLAYMANFVIQK